VDDRNRCATLAWIQSPRDSKMMTCRSKCLPSRCLDIQRSTSMPYGCWRSTFLQFKFLWRPEMFFRSRHSLEYIQEGGYYCSCCLGMYITPLSDLLFFSTTLILNTKKDVLRSDTPVFITPTTCSIITSHHCFAIRKRPLQTT
jgi:hypothetical protein